MDSNDTPRSQSVIIEHSLMRLLCLPGLWQIAACPESRKGQQKAKVMSHFELNTSVKVAWRRTKPFLCGGKLLFRQTSNRECGCNLEARPQRPSSPQGSNDCTSLKRLLSLTAFLLAAGQLPLGDLTLPNIQKDHQMTRRDGGTFGAAFIVLKCCRDHGIALHKILRLAKIAATTKLQKPWTVLSALTVCNHILNQQ